MDVMSLFAPLATLDGWLSLCMLIFLELALGIDNLVFISITTNRVKKSQQHITRRLGLMAAMLMRCFLLCCIVWILSVNVDLFTLPFGGEGEHTVINVHDIIFLLGGAYLVFKGVQELREIFHYDPSDDIDGDGISDTPKKPLSLPRAVVTIMIMDIVFSLDSVITAAGLSGQILVMCLAVILAVTVMIVLADPIADFINNNFEVKLVALLFITLVGVELLLDGLHYHEIAGADISTLLYGMMLFGFATAALIMATRKQKEKAASRCNNMSVESVSSQAAKPQGTDDDVHQQLQANDSHDIIRSHHNKDSEEGVTDNEQW